VRSITIVGAGIGGLAAAAALRRGGVAVNVYEQADKFARVGAGIQQSPNAVRVLRGLGIEDRLRQVAFHPASSLNRDGTSGKVTNDHPLGRELEQRYGAPYLTLHRGDLHEALASIVPAECVHLGKKLVAVNARGARVELSFADGSEVEADAVIGADGVHSLLRDHVVGTEQPRFAGGSPTAPRFPPRCCGGSRSDPRAPSGGERTGTSSSTSSPRRVTRSTSPPASPSGPIGSPGNRGPRKVPSRRCGQHSRTSIPTLGRS
jgi:2-polyprenyl-6-methoxyphenol hydroxylase-like FAD-dependent oxidoreductase